MKLTIGHTPDTDDAFMLHGLLAGKVDCEGLEFRQVVEPIAVLNRKAPQGELHVTALSVGAVPTAANRYELLTAGACAAMGESFSGPLLVQRWEKLPPKVAVPGLETTGHLAARVFAGDFEPVVMSFSEILPAVTEGRIGAGVLISEDQYRVKGLGLKVVDLGAICLEKLGAPLFLGVDAVRSDLPGDVRLAVDRVFRRSVQYALEHEEEALDAAMQYARGLDRETVRGFVKAYVGVHTVHLGAAGCEAIRRFLRLASLRGLVCDHCEARFVGDKPLEEPAHQELHDPH